MVEKGIYCEVHTRELMEGYNYISFYLHGRKPKDAADLQQNGRLIFIPLTTAQRSGIARYLNEIKSKIIKRTSRLDGLISVSAHTPIKFIRWEEFSPFAGGKRPLRKGIGTAIHAAITDYLAKNYPAHRITHDIEVSASRVEQMHAMGIDPFAEYPIEEYNRLVQEYRVKRKAEGKD